MARTGTLTVLTTKLRHPDTVQHSIDRCLVSKKISYVCYLKIYHQAQTVQLKWCDVIYPRLHVNYTRSASRIYFDFNGITIVFIYEDTLSIKIHHARIVTRHCDIEMRGRQTLDASYIGFNYVGSLHITNTIMSDFRKDLTLVEKNKDLWSYKYDFAKLIYQLCVRYNL